MNEDIMQKLSVKDYKYHTGSAGNTQIQYGGKGSKSHLVSATKGVNGW